MIKLTIISKDEYANYILKDINDNKYELNINFMNIEKPKVGTDIYIQESVIKENISLNYGLVNSDSKPNKDELIVILDGKKQMYLQRYYG